MGTICSAKHEEEPMLFYATFTAPLRTLFDRYSTVIEFLRTSELFAQESVQLTDSIEVYFQDPVGFDQKNLNLVAIDSVHKLHPLDYNTPVVTR
jgi:hypothetical protein